MEEEQTQCIKQLMHKIILVFFTPDRDSTLYRYINTEMSHGFLCLNIFKHVLRSQVLLKTEELSKPGHTDMHHSKPSRVEWKKRAWLLYVVHHVGSIMTELSWNYSQACDSPHSFARSFIYRAHVVYLIGCIFMHALIQQWICSFRSPKGSQKWDGCIMWTNLLIPIY